MSFERNAGQGHFVYLIQLVSQHDLFLFDVFSFSIVGCVVIPPLVIFSG